MICIYGLRLLCMCLSLASKGADVVLTLKGYIQDGSDDTAD